MAATCAVSSTAAIARRRSDLIAVTATRAIIVAARIAWRRTRARALAIAARVGGHSALRVCRASAARNDRKVGGCASVWLSAVISSVPSCLCPVLSSGTNNSYPRSREYSKTCGETTSVKTPLFTRSRQGQRTRRALNAIRALAFRFSSIGRSGRVM